MHYYIDGYNLLFALFGTGSNDLKSQRERLIHDLNTKIEFLALDISVVFDSHFCPGEGSRGHYHHLEILYTPQNITADDFIINQIKRSSNSTKDILVTNDKPLASRARDLLAGTQTLEHFLNWLDRRYSNKRHTKLKPTKSNPIKILSESTAAQKSLVNITTQSPVREPPKLIPLPELSSHIATPLGPQAGSLEYYLQQFESSFTSLTDKRQIAKAERKKSKLVKHPQKRPQEQTEVNTKQSDFERWLDIFEKHDL